MNFYLHGIHDIQNLNGGQDLVYLAESKYNTYLDPHCDMTTLAII